jgi:hypothetical protein
MKRISQRTDSLRRGRPTAFCRIWVSAFVCVLFARVAQGRVSVTAAPLAGQLFSDSFDTNNVVGTPPANWRISAPKGTTVRVVDASVTEPSSPPYCVELVDNSSTGRPEMYQEFAPTGAGRASASFKLNSPATAHAALQLRSTRGGHLCSVVFADGSLMRSEGAGGNVISTTPWTAGQWQTVQIEWFSDFTYNAFLGDTQFAQRAHFATNAVPGKLYVTVGYGSATNKIGYVDDVKVVGTE